MARRGGVKRISGGIYDDVRGAMVDRLKTVGVPIHASVLNAEC